MSRVIMRKKVGAAKWLLVAVLIGNLLAAGVPAQPELVPVADLTGGSSVFVLRRAAKTGPRKFTTSAATVTKSQRIERAKKVNRQYVQLAKVTPRRSRSK